MRPATRARNRTSSPRARSPARGSGATRAGRRAVAVEPARGGKLRGRLTRESAPVRGPLFAADGRLRSLATVQVTDRDIGQLRRHGPPVGPGDPGSIIPSIAGGPAVAEQLP